MAAWAKSKHFYQGQAAFIMQEPQRRLYLDFNATAPMRPAVRDAVIERMAATGNASSIHADGRAARGAIERARAEVGTLCGVGAEHVTFTSGATEAAALALSPSLGILGEAPMTRLLVGATEHPAVRRGHRFAAGDVAVVPVDAEGRLRLDALAALLQGSGPVLLALQAANSETGVIQPVLEAAATVHAAGGLVVCDAVQAAGRIPITDLGADVVLLSAHKLGGPQGVGALVARRHDLRIGAPLLRGGGQERGLRSGTENGPGIVGFGVAARLAAAEAGAATAVLRDRLEAGLRSVAPVTIFGGSAPRLPNTIAFAVAGIANATALIALDLAGISISTGSACSSGKVARSEVLEAMGVDAALAGGMLRVSLGWCSTAGDVDRFIEAFGAFMRRMQARPVRAAA